MSKQCDRNHNCSLNFSKMFKLIFITLFGIAFCSPQGRYLAPSSSAPAPPPAQAPAQNYQKPSFSSSSGGSHSSGSFGGGFQGSQASQAGVGGYSGSTGNSGANVQLSSSGQSGTAVHSGSHQGGFQNSQGGFGGSQGGHAAGAPEVTRNIFVYEAPQLEAAPGQSPSIPKQKINYNIVFIRTPERPEGASPVVVPPPQQKTIVYVLTKKGQSEQQVIEVPAGPNQQPDVYYVNYGEGDNPTLPGGFTLQEALSSAISQSGQVVQNNQGGSSGGQGGSSGFGFGGSVFGQAGAAQSGSGGSFTGTVNLGSSASFGGGQGQSYSAPSSGY